MEENRKQGKESTKSSSPFHVVFTPGEPDKSHLSVGRCSCRKDPSFSDHEAIFSTATYIVQAVELGDDILGVAIAGDVVDEGKENVIKA